MWEGARYGVVWCVVCGVYGIMCEMVVYFEWESIWEVG